MGWVNFQWEKWVNFRWEFSTDDGNCFREEYIPRKFYPLLGKLYDFRTIIERRNSYEVVGYHRSEMPTPRINWARCFISISNITSLLTALTAYKVGRFIATHLLIMM